MLLVLVLMDESSLQVMARAWLATASGEVRATDFPRPSTPLSLESDLGFGDLSAGFSVQVRTRLVGPIFASFEYGQVEVTGSDTVTAPFNFERRLFAVGERVETELTLRRASFDVEYDFAFGGRGVMPGHFAPFIGMRWYLPSIQLRNKTMGFTEDDHFLPIVPAAGVRLRMEPTPWLELGATIGGGAGPDFESTAARFFHASAEARAVFGNFTAAAGYQWETLDFEKDRHGESELEADVHGPFLELGLRF